MGDFGYKKERYLLYCLVDDEIYFEILLTYLEKRPISVAYLVSGTHNKKGGISVAGFDKIEKRFPH
ncbi:hypothetical protein DGG96_03525 [Legionella qingyii]|uniref:Uncharacterized protein n=1 Tax=Legionella qingyii TaxID=2184757 RepID=A0A317U7A3_9GAMM|nr:hypothetical protein [Legionella qingyii]PWY57068.1 hypothetical protein DGG96_03525 [Legionella qingyii]